MTLPLSTGKAGRSRFFVLFTFALALLLSAFPVVAQVSSGDVVGQVLDASGGAVPNAKIDATNTLTGVTSSTVTNGTGEYRLSNLLAGTYDLSATATGFAPAQLKGVVVDANKEATANISVALGTASTSVQVVESVPVIDTTTATIENVFDTAMARDLPVTSIGLGSANLALLNAGVSGNGGLGVGEGPSVGGQRPRNNNFMVEGVDANNKSVTGSLIRSIPNDAVAEFNVLQNQDTAQYGHSSGGQFNTILKSGTNQFHGTLYEYLQNRNLDAIDQLIQNQAYGAGVKPVNPRFDNNRFGGSFGGPVIKNKIFFFGDYEYNPVGLPATPSAISAPTAAGYTALSGIAGLSQTNLSVLKKYLPAANQADPTLEPYPVVNGVSIPVGDLQVTAPAFQNNQTLVTTFDYNISDKDQLRGRYIYNRLSQIDTNANLAAFFTSNINTYQVASLAEYHNFTPAVNNELRLGYNRLNQPTSAGNFSYPGLDSFPNIQIDELGVNIGPDPNAPQITIQNTYQLSDNMTWVKGRHTIQFGFDARRYISPQTFTQRSRGDYEYSTLALFLQDITPDNLAQRSVGNPVYYGDQYQSGEYLQDTFRYNPHLTITAGLRYEHTTVPVGERTQILNAAASVPGFLTFGVPKSQMTNFAPRIGLAYSPGSDGKTSIRAGFGIAYDVIYDNIGILALPPQLSTTIDVSDAGTPNFLKNGGILPTASAVGTTLTPAQARANTSAYIPNQELPYSIQWNFGFQHVFANNYTFEARYLGTKGVHLDVQDRINKQAPVTATNSLPTYLTAPSQATLNSLPLTLSTLSAESNLVPVFAANGFTNAAFVEDSPIGYSSYNGLALQLNRRFSNGLQFQGAYTWSHLIDNSTADFNTSALTPRRPEDFQNLAADKATSALDRRQRFTMAAYYDAPWFRRSNWLMKNLVGNWIVAPIYTYESPEYYTVQSNTDSNLNGDSASDRVIVNPNGTPGTGSGVTPLTNSAGQTVAYLATNPTAQYIVAGKGAYANAGRNTLPGRPTNNIDLSLFKNFNATERMKVQVGAQFFNFFNHPQYIPGFADRADNPTVLNTSAADKLFVTPGNSLFNNPTQIFSSNPRTIQITAKFSF